MAFNHMASQIEKNEKMRRDFLADVSHELRSPLASIQGFIEAMIDGKDKTPEKRKNTLEFYMTKVSGWQGWLMSSWICQRWSREAWILSGNL